MVIIVDPTSNIVGNITSNRYVLKDTLYIVMVYNDNCSFAMDVIIDHRKVVAKDSDDKGLNVSGINNYLIVSNPSMVYLVTSIIHKIVINDQVYLVNFMDVTTDINRNRYLD